MGRTASNGGPSFRFNMAEVSEMEAMLQANNIQVPAREVLIALAEKFSSAPDRVGKFEVQMKQVWNWFQNRRYAIRAKAGKSPGKLSVSMPQNESATVRSVPQAPQSLPSSTATAKNIPQPMQPSPDPTAQITGGDVPEMEFEARSARDGAWYDVARFLSIRFLENGDPEVLVRFSGFGPEEDEWINVQRHVRQRSLPCESSECIAVLPGDLILCFQEGKEQALYFDAHVLDSQRRRHDVRGCRCRFLVRYDHDRSEEIVPLRKVCRRPETDYRLQLLYAVTPNVIQPRTGADTRTGNTLRAYPPVDTPNPQPETEQADVGVTVTQTNNQENAGTDSHSGINERVNPSAETIQLEPIVETGADTGSMAPSVPVSNDSNVLPAQASEGGSASRPSAP